MKGEKMGKICVPIAERTLHGASRAIEEAREMADLIELRVDYLKKPVLKHLLKKGGPPFIITNRRRVEGGKHRGTEEERLGVLKEAIDLEAEYVDIEVRSDRSAILNLLAGRKETKIILSFHDFERTPSRKSLKSTFDQMAQLEADLIKIVTLARSWEDNFSILSLLSYAKEKKKEIIAFCMGEKGKMSRIFSPLMGGAWTYASLTSEGASAPGQLPVEEIREIYKRLR
ncbi:MAG: type I 3-dehydroquinate dehydratase [Deltaproteobacteria bacterium]|nr:type I 3-dehydroquinate dehydratase [Deltaproteobacteria bacterium]